ncbi:PHD finger protein 7-like isoform X2 [Sipha flava]|uniref:PHD finger protein 7-like isoform X2 n=2 Tax=Sipha flava TaxID=143950 RepID=A0A8B8FJX4_9HEMI|nr:PHD finger protein 7-like isoform X2 [Sipha flava]
MAPVTRRKHKNVRKVTAKQPMLKDKMVVLSLRDGKACMFCNRKEISEKAYGPLYQLNDIIVHYFCILLSSRAVQNGSDKEGIWGFLFKDIKNELIRGAREICTYCKKPGATISCCTPRCRKIFHLPCGLKNGSMHQFFQTFKSFCQQHRVAQNIDIQDIQHSTPVQCSICKEDVIPTPLPSSIWAPCCKRNAWFHRDCIQELALNAGYFFKCPLCNNVELFKSRMLTLGIYIPSRDASWETVPDAYVELLERHSTCNADTCLCPHPERRNFQQETGSWEIILCHACGSYGTHKLCSSLKCNEQWYCNSCHSIAVTENPVTVRIRRLEITDNTNSPTTTQVEITSSQTSNLSQVDTRGTLMNLTSRDRARQVRNNRGVLGNNVARQPLFATNEVISLLSDDEEDVHENNAEADTSNGNDVQYIAYIEPPNQVIEQSFLPVIQCYSSVSSSTSNGLNENGFHYKSITPSSSTLRTAMYCQTESIDLTLDDD